MALNTATIIVGTIIVLGALGGLSTEIVVTVLLYRSLEQLTRMLTGNRSTEIETRRNYDAFRRELADDRVSLATRFTQIESGLEQQFITVRQRLDRLESRERSSS
jgi:hypothetical protein